MQRQQTIRNINIFHYGEINEMFKQDVNKSHKSKQKVNKVKSFNKKLTALKFGTLFEAKC